MTSEPGRWRIPAEHEHHAGTLISWPTTAGVYGPLVDTARAAHAEVARVIATAEPVSVLAHPEEAEVARALCGHAIEVIALEIDDSWVRDTGPIFQVDDTGTQRRATLWQFNGYGHKYPHSLDATVAARWCALTGESTLSMPMVLEGGSVVSDGVDTLLTTTQCLMHPTRNPHLGRHEIEAHLRAASGMEQIVWLPHGLSLDHDTDGHVDNIAAFAPDGRVIVQACEDRNDPDHDRLEINRRWLAGHRRSDGSPYEVIDIPVLPRVEVARRTVSVPYLNFYVANGLVVVPVCGHPADAEMLDLIGAAYPGRQVVGVEVGEILAFGGGGIHCITQQIPAVG